jgi:hypothetical protein
MLELFCPSPAPGDPMQEYRQQPNPGACAPSFTHIPGAGFQISHLDVCPSWAPMSICTSAGAVP